MGGYTTYLYLNARFSDFSTTHEIAMWSLGLIIQSVVIGIQVIRYYKMPFISLRFLFFLLIPFAICATTFLPGRGMETQVFLSVVLLTIIVASPTWHISLRVYAPTIFITVGVYVFVLSSAYFIGALAATLVTAIFVLFGKPSSGFRSRVIAITLAFATWGLAYVVTLKAFATPGMVSQQSLIDLTSRDPFFPMKYFLHAISGVSLTINSGEYFGARFSAISILGGIAVLLSVIVLGLSVSRNDSSREKTYFPLTLIAYSFATAGAVLIGRHSDTLYGLNTWYGFQYRPLAGGILVLAIAYFGRNWRKRNILSTSTLIICLTYLLLIGVIAGGWEWKRNNYERTYFLNIRSYVLSQGTSTVSTNKSYPELTPIYLDDVSSRRAIEFLFSHRLVPFNNHLRQSTPKPGVK
jgi:hypothetical protein